LTKVIEQQRRLQIYDRDGFPIRHVAGSVFPEAVSPSESCCSRLYRYQSMDIDRLCQSGIGIIRTKQPRPENSILIDGFLKDETIMLLWMLSPADKTEP
jgi:hypothetical protein